MYSVSLNISFLTKQELNLLSKVKMTLLNIGYELVEKGHFVITDNLTDESVKFEGLTTFNIQSKTFKQDMLNIFH